jgi:molecular chaperone GrpE
MLPPEDNVIEAEIVEEPAAAGEGAPSPVPVASVEESAQALGVELPDDRDQAIAVLLEALATAQSSADAYLDDLRRVAAEFENFRKRAQRELEEMMSRSSQRVVEALLPVLDTFDQAFTHTPASPAEENLLAGMRGTFHQLMDVLSKEGLEIVPGVGAPFDPTVHEAASGGGDGELIVSQEWRRGYVLGGRVIRPALVAVEAESEQGTPDTTEDDSEEG